MNASKNSKDRSEKAKSNLVSESVPPSVTVKLAARLPQELKLSQIYSENLPGILVDFHGLIPATFLPILKNLQRIQREGELTFQKWVLPGRNSDNDRVKIPPPAYARTPGFVFSLASVSKDGSDDVKPDPSFPETVELLKLETQTGLDRGQCQGLFAALTRDHALIQGPPGTGKSYVGVKLVQVLLDVKEKAKLGPILVM
ncbi:hypothetical protein PENDEC_c016G01602 [Penicillium decumbens]|uniref:DNA2/NAM7 helicase helicase domain-containing protein n=1 Tax=Penicillium decumbens TaxID=69771 RepID=A0A1V6P9H7_PENDC|nr:hypothetical protein PENDEC_c016G01602 [Penicillium decumbens]